MQVQQFRKKYGIKDKVSDRGYVSNSFHCHVAEKISPIEKQNLENRFWNLFNGGKIQYVKYPISYNTKAVEHAIQQDRAYARDSWTGRRKRYLGKLTNKGEHLLRKKVIDGVLPLFKDFSAIYNETLIKLNNREYLKTIGETYDKYDNYLIGKKL